MILIPSDLDAFGAAEAARPDTVVEGKHALIRQRIAVVADLCCAHFEGDLIEIGSYAGATSIVLARAARNYARKLICVDNWLPGPHNFDKVGEEFQKTMRFFSDVLVTIKADAHAPETIALIQKRRYAFAFTDDGNDFEDHLTELRTMLPVVEGAVVVDGANLPWVIRAVEQAVSEHPGWTILADKRISEAYLVRT